MCGLVGVAGQLGYKDESIIRKLLILDFFRGPDSTGLAAIRTSGDVKMAKVANDPITLFGMTKFTEAMNGNASKVFLGHNRAATRGKVNNGNAHPFHYDHIVGAHNGTLNYSTVVRLEDALGEKFDVDSMALFAAIAKLGIADTMDMLEEGREGSSGAWALSWYDDKENSLNFLRNQHRPLWYAYSEELDRLYWASESPMITAACALQGSSKLYVDKEGYSLFPFGKDIHYKFDLDKLREGKKVPKPTVVERKGKEPTPAVVTGGSDPFRRTPTNTSGSGNPTLTGNVPLVGFHVPNSKKNGATATQPSKMIYHMTGSLESPYAGWISRDQFEDITRRGCGFCMKPVQWGDKAITIFERDEMVIGECCTREKQATPRIFSPNLSQISNYL